MGRFFDLDSPLVRGLSKLADVMLLNLLTLIFAIPLIVEQYITLGPLFLTGSEVSLDPSLAMNYIFWAWLFGIICCIPLGAALTAMHFVLLKVVRDEESYIAKSFFKSFKENFKQSSILMVLQFVIGGILVLDYMITSQRGNLFRYIFFAVALVLYMASLYIFPLQAKFENSLWGTIKNSFLVSVMALPRTVAMVISTMLPVLFFYFFDFKILPLIFLLGIAGPGYLCAALYSDTFRKFEPKEEKLSEEEELSNAIAKIDEDAPVESDSSDDKT
jgi:uncharacterized membrane protein YesL